MPRELTDTVDIAPGVAMPRLGFGTYRSAPGEETEQAVAWALAAGYRSIDTASLYGNEASVGSVVRSSGIAREEIFVATKVWNDDQGYESTLRAFDASLERLGFEYVDLYLVHWAILSRMRETWRAMEEIVESGRTRAIGVCNHLPHHLDALATFANVPPAIDQVEFHPRLQQPRVADLLRRALDSIGGLGAHHAGTRGRDSRDGRDSSLPRSDHRPGQSEVDPSEGSRCHSEVRAPGTDPGECRPVLLRTVGRGDGDDRRARHRGADRTRPDSLRLGLTTLASPGIVPRPPSTSWRLVAKIAEAIPRAS